MNTESHGATIPWVPASGHQLRKAGVHFDAVRLPAGPGRDLADALADLTSGEPGPVIEELSGERHVYFLVRAGSTAHRQWPPQVHRLTGGQGRDCYVGVPALYGHTWPIVWRYQPLMKDHFVHVPLLHATLRALCGRARLIEWIDSARDS